MEYTTVFDVAQSGYRQWPFAAFGLIFVAIGSGKVFFRQRLRRGTHRFFSFAYLGFAISWTLVVFVGTATDYSGLVSDLRGGRCEVTEGIVTDFDPMPYMGHKMESFVVNNKHFKYSDYNVVAGFNNTASHGGPIRQGVHVRIHHRGNDIARLEIGR